MSERQSLDIRRWWTEDEDRVLRREAAQQLQVGPLNDWNRIATQLPGRSNKDCRKRWSKICTNVKKGAWDQSEDRRLLAAVKKHGLCWTEVAQKVGTRHADQCAKRWQHSLDPNVIHRKWVAQEDEKLVEAVKVHGRNWSKISEEAFPNRSTTDIKNRHALIMRRQQSQRTSANVQAETAHLSESTSEESSEEEAANDNTWMEDTEMANSAPDNAALFATVPSTTTFADMSLPALYHSVNKTDDIFTTDPMNLVQMHPASSLSLPWKDASNFATSTNVLPEASADPLSFLPGSLPTPTSLMHSTPPEPTLQSWSGTASGTAMTNQSKDESKFTLIMQNVEPHTLRNIVDILYKDRVKYKLDVDHD